MQVGRWRDKTRIGWWLSAAKSGWVSGGRRVNGREWLTFLEYHVLEKTYVLGY